MTQTWRQVLRPQTQVSPVHWSPVVSPSARPWSGLVWGESGEEMVWILELASGKCWLGWRSLSDRPAEGWRGPERTLHSPLKRSSPTSVLLRAGLNFLIEAN